jgi:uncharacterized protein YdhG (YjbR/CyaY superfamily)
MTSDDPAVTAYVDAIDPGLRPLFDRVLDSLQAGYPDADLVLSYDMPTLKAGGHRLHLGVWKHGVSLYGWRADSTFAENGGFVERHPDLLHGKGTIRIRPADADAISDDELSDLARATLSP